MTRNNEKPARRRKINRDMLKRVFSISFWKNILRCVVYFALSALVVHDLVFLVGRSFSEKFLPHGRAIFLDNLLQSISGSIGGLFGM